MAEIMLINKAGVLLPANAQDAELLAKIKDGSLVTATIQGKRNPDFHRKFFALLNVGFEAFEPPDLEYKGLPAQKNFDRFRADVIVAAGYYDVVASIKGEVRAEPKSIAFARMDEIEFGELYSKCCNVILQRILTRYTRADLDRVVEHVLRF